ncbi:hypothetical protein [Marinomonas gallaica]|uniref:hypothetical protein n=1 Tax=Marinomonas gallaica TaxID=1806667 RepID=UPI000831F15B|nr:hypothetical protein [Marinomonas gallaica]
MQISNNASFGYGQLGLQRSQNSLEQASANIANASVASLKDSTGLNSDNVIRESLVDVKTSELNAKANAKVIGAADDMLGTLIDLKV